MSGLIEFVPLEKKKKKTLNTRTFNIEAWLVMGHCLEKKKKKKHNSGSMGRHAIQR